MKAFFTLIILLLPLKIVISAEDEQVNNLFKMSLDELLKVKIQSGTITDIENLRIPVSVTTITSEEIEITPARNLYDLLETYVPGAIWMNHHDSPDIGMRGLITDRNYKILLLVNGKNMNMKARNGATSELENWDLSDIEKIEIIRGPGSVTYGPGAVEAVINITTKKYTPDENFNISTSSCIPYRNYGITGNGGLKINDNINIFMSGSVVSTQGLNSINGVFIGDTYTYGKTSDPIFKNWNWQNYFFDYRNQPQIKFHLGIEFYDEFKLWTRFTTLGNTTNGLFGKSQYQTGIDSAGNAILSSPYNVKQSKDEHLTFAFEDEHKFNESFTLNSIVSWSSENNTRQQEYFQTPPLQYFLPDQVRKQLMDINSLRNKYYYFAEDELLLKMTAKNSFNSEFSAAFGFEYSLNHWGAPWGQSENNFRMGDNSNIISGPNSDAYGNPIQFGVDSSNAIFVGKGWSTITYSVFGELNWQLLSNFTALISARIDKDSYSQFLFSPRIAFIYDLDKSNIIKLVSQQSLRMNTAEELLIEHLAGKNSSSEKLHSIELIYTGLLSEKMLINISSFYNHVNILSWYDFDRTTRLTGSLSLIGIEADYRYTFHNLDIGINHSFVKQLKWTLADSLSQNGISYSDYNYPINGSVLKGVGNDLNNWPNHSTKLFVNFKLFNNILILHVDTKIFWGYQGSLDGLQMIANAIPGNIDSTSLNKLVQTAKNSGLYKGSFCLNSTITYNISNKIAISAYFINLITSEYSYRYTYDAGEKRQDNVFDYVLKLNAIKEPLRVGLKLKYSL